MSQAAWYDEYATRQEAEGINERHHRILAWLRYFGLQPGMNVLEIGCGVGTVTQLIASHLDFQGSLTGVDLSPTSIELAQARCQQWPNVNLHAAPILDFVLADSMFDAIVLPDVLEHIPIRQHDLLWTRISQWLRPDGWVMIHMPDPWYLEHLKQTEPDMLQLVDQPIWTEQLAASTRRHGFRVNHLQTYTIWEPNDYQVIHLRPMPSLLSRA